jgi:hypothetical protein
MNVAAENKLETKGIPLQTVEVKQMKCMNLKLRYFYPRVLKYKTVASHPVLLRLDAFFTL